MGALNLNMLNIIFSPLFPNFPTMPVEWGASGEEGAAKTMMRLIPREGEGELRCFLICCTFLSYFGKSCAR